MGAQPGKEAASAERTPLLALPRAVDAYEGTPWGALTAVLLSGEPRHAASRAALSATPPACARLRRGAALCGKGCIARLGPRSFKTSGSRVPQASRRSCTAWWWPSGASSAARRGERCREAPGVTTVARSLLAACLPPHLHALSLRCADSLNNAAPPRRRACWRQASSPPRSCPSSSPSRCSPPPSARRSRALRPTRTGAPACWRR